MRDAIALLFAVGGTLSVTTTVATVTEFPSPAPPCPACRHMRDAIALLIAVGGTLSVTTTVATIAWVRARDRAKILQEQLRQWRQVEAETDLRRAVESMAVEIERLGESQRFMSRMLGERTPIPISPPQSRMNTPH